MELMDIVLLIVGNEQDCQLRGRTLLQKKCYFVSALLEKDFGYGAYYYGPYSREVFTETRRLVASDFLDESVDCYPDQRNIFGEVTCYTYSLTEDGKEIFQNLQSDECYHDAVDAIARINEHPISSDFNELSIAAKVYYIVDKEGRTTKEKIVQKAREYGWKITDDQIDNVCSFLSHLNLITTD